MAKFELSNPPGVVRAASSYSLAAVIPAGARRVLVSGQVGMASDGVTPPDIESQTENAFNNIRLVLEAHGLGLSDIVKTTAFLTDRSQLPAYRAVRSRIMGDRAPASTLLFVSGLADPKFLVEIEAEAVG